MAQALESQGPKPESPTLMGSPKFSCIEEVVPPRYNRPWRRNSVSSLDTIVEEEVAVVEGPEIPPLSSSSSSSSKASCFLQAKPSFKAYNMNCPCA
ncbi:hypothetical protein AMTR_s00092p00087600 [Amborella trichopoda]|uniref:Uncharacterized protein n=1 Tax=Amborella trichopoda TaxID=13333 RepID=W1NUE2_AMBTC|nr:hypothetical protein AMTR_s00092p00087600 [Amborella trichopoda]